jgi:glutathionylspermidine synthase
VAVDSAAREVVDTVLRALEHEALYGRVDLVRDPGGEWRLMELELIEPRLFLEAAPGSGARVAEAILARAT